MKLLSVTITLVFFSLLFASPILPGPIEYNSDGSITVTTSSGTRVRQDMDGKTPYGLPVDSYTRSVVSDNIVIKLEYSSTESDENMPEYLKNLIDETAGLLGKWAGEKKDVNIQISVLFSYCRHCTTGYCRRSGLRGINVTVVTNGKKAKPVHVSPSRLMVKKAYIDIAAGLSEIITKGL